MKNKILIKLIVPALMSEFEIFIPVNERICKLKELFVKALNEVAGANFDLNKIYSLIDPDTGTIYDSRLAVRETNLINSKRIILY